MSNPLKSIGRPLALSPLAYADHSPAFLIDPDGNETDPWASKAPKGNDYDPTSFRAFVGEFFMSRIPPSLSGAYIRQPTTVEMSGACGRGMGTLCMQARDKYIAARVGEAYRNVNWWMGQGLAVVGALQQGLGQLATSAFQPTTASVSAGTTGGALQACFVAGTPVWTPNGLTPIEQLRLGDTVLSWDERTESIVTARVTAIYVYTSIPTIQLTLDTPNRHEVIETTREHPFFVEDLGWTDAEQLRVDDKLASSTSSSLKVAAAINNGTKRTVYNLSVGPSQTYFVGISKALVHNKPMPYSPREIALGIDIPGGGVKELAKRTNSAHFKQWGTAGITRRIVTNRFGRAFHQAAQRSDRIHFTMEGIPTPARRSGVVRQVSIREIIRMPSYTTLRRTPRYSRRPGSMTRGAT